jgi:nucleoside-diphosphate-sugar epimerase
VSGALAILGASGFVGSALCERLAVEGGRDFVAIVHTSGRAGRIARLGVPMRSMDLMDRASVSEALEGFEVVVDCALGNHETMTRGFKNLVAVLRERRPRLFVHLSSILIYGEDPAPASETEEMAPDPGRNEYGRTKLWQDRMVVDLHRNGVPCIILCPGNITGPYSPFARALCERLLRGPMPLVDGGRAPSNLVHVDNLVEAILAAVRGERGTGERYFVNETRPVPWRDVFSDLCAHFGVPASFVDVTREEVLRAMAAARPPRGLKAHLRVAASDEFRRAVTLLPIVAAANRAAFGVFAHLPPATRELIRQRVRWPVGIAKHPTTPSLDDRFVRLQLRRYYHSTAKLAGGLGWRAPLTYEQGLEATMAWMRFAGIPPERL